MLFNNRKRQPLTTVVFDIVNYVIAVYFTVSVLEKLTVVPVFNLAVIFTLPVISLEKEKPKGDTPEAKRVSPRIKSRKKGAGFHGYMTYPWSPALLLYICLKIHPRREKRKAILLREILQRIPTAKTH